MILQSLVSSNTENSSTDFFDEFDIQSDIIAQYECVNHINLNFERILNEDAVELNEGVIDFLKSVGKSIVELFRKFKNWLVSFFSSAAMSATEKQEFAKIVKDRIEKSNKDMSDLTYKGSGFIHILNYKRFGDYTVTVPYNAIGHNCGSNVGKLVDSFSTDKQYSKTYDPYLLQPIS